MNGWPFLVARGHRRGYSVLLAPPFMIQALDYGLLEQVVGPVSAAEPVRTTTTGNRCVVWSEHTVTAADLADGSETHDEHSRPLRLLYGLVVPDATVARPSEVDLERSCLAALDTYRRFLADEKHFTVEPSTPVDLRSAAVPSSPPSSPPSGTTTPPRPPSHWRYTGAALLAGLVIGVTGALVITSDSPEPVPPPTPTTPTATAPSTAPSSAPSEQPTSPPRP